MMAAWPRASPSPTRAGAACRRISPRGSASPRCCATARRCCFIGVWFAINFVFGVAAVPLGLATDAGIAWQAHIGGFVVGLFRVPVVRPRGRG